VLFFLSFRVVQRRLVLFFLFYRVAQGRFSCLFVSPYCAFLVIVFPCCLSALFLLLQYGAFRFVVVLLGDKVPRIK
jgi:hypothetical protein